MKPEATDCIAQGYCSPKHRSKKDRKHWCGGREGLLHDYIWSEKIQHLGGPDAMAWWADKTRYTERATCQNCGRVEGWRSKCRCCGSVWKRGGGSIVVEGKPGQPSMIVRLCPVCGVREDDSFARVRASASPSRSFA